MKEKEEQSRWAKASQLRYKMKRYYEKNVPVLSREFNI